MIFDFRLVGTDRAFQIWIVFVTCRSIPFVDVDRNGGTHGKQRCKPMLTALTISSCIITLAPYSTVIQLATMALLDLFLSDAEAAEPSSLNSSTLLRSCLKRNDSGSTSTTTTSSSSRSSNFTQECAPPTPRRRVSFFEYVTVESITSLKSLDLWNNHNQDKWYYEDKRSVHTDRSAHNYVMVHAEAHHLFVRNKKVPSDLMEHLVFGVKQGHRSLERHSPYKKQRQRETHMIVCSVVYMHRCLAAAGYKKGWDTKLRKHSEKFSKVKCDWALFMASVDADAVEECVWTMPAVSRSTPIPGKSVEVVKAVTLSRENKDGLVVVMEKSQQHTDGLVVVTNISEQQGPPLWRAVKRFAHRIFHRRKNSSASPCNTRKATVAWRRLWKRTQDAQEQQPRQ